MRFESLTLERYGRFENRTLDLSGDEVRLHLVFGPNEAGKSTLLNAVADLLFGIPARTPFAFRWDYGQLRLAATIRGTDGERLAFKRRKGNAGTLLSDTEATLPDGALGRFLGSADRNLFERMFGLDHERLRAGGRRMLESGGDLALSLFEAGSGLARVNEALERIREQIAAIGTLDRRTASRPIWQQIDRYQKAQGDVRAGALRGEEWGRAEQALEVARQERRTVGQRIDALRQRRSRLDRIRRVSPILQAIDQREERLRGFDPLAARLPEGFEAEWRERDTAAREAEGELVRAGEQLARAESEAAEAPAPLGFLAGQEEIEALHEALGDIRQKIADEPKLERYVAEDDAEIADQLHRLGLDPAQGNVLALAPDLPFAARLRDMARKGEGVRTRLEGHEAALRAARREEAEAAERMAALSGVMGDVDAAGHALGEALRLGEVEARLARAQADVSEAVRDLATAHAGLSGWAGRPEDLAERPFPAAETVTRHDERLRKADEAVEAAAGRRRATERELAGNAAEMEGLGAAGEIPSPAAIRAARDRRDQVWRLLRARLGVAAGTSEEVGRADAGEDLPASFETALRHADELVDRREAEVHRVTRFTDLSAARERLVVALEADRRDEGDARRARDAAQAEWEILWSGLVEGPGRPPEMLGWLRRRTEALASLAARRRAEQELDRVRQDAAEAQRHLGRAAGALGLPNGESEPLADLLRRVQQAHRGAVATRTERASRSEALAAAQARARRAEDERAAAVEELESWQAGWSEAAARLGLSPDATTAEVEAALGVWDAVRERSTARAEHERRLRGLRADIRTFGERLRALHAVLGPAVAAIDPAAPEMAVRTLHAGLQEDLLRADRARALAERVEAARLHMTTSRDEAAGILEQRSELLRRHGLEGHPDPAAAAEEARERRLVLAELVAKRDELAAAGDGQDEAALREEAGSSAADEVAAGLQALAEEERRLVEAGQNAARAETQAEHELAALAGRQGAAEPAQEARHAALEIGILAERWMRLEAAKHLLERALERYRAANEHPLVRRAGEVFASLTEGSPNPFVRLEARQGEKDAPVLVAQRTDGSDCEVDGLSEGTRDQLFLALRIAALERHMAEHGALPFLADDLFITSDDQRIVPGLRALAELGQRTQVILFTHHAHVVETAQRTLPKGAVREHRL